MNRSMIEFARRAGATLAAVAILGSLTGCPFLDALAPQDGDIKTSVLRWNQISVDTSGLDHSPLRNGEDRTFGHQLGPGKSSRAAAITQIAVFDAINAVTREYETYTRLPASEVPVSLPAAIAQAAHDTLVALYPSHTLRLDGLLAEELAKIPNGLLKENGIELGAAAAAAILKMRENDGSEIVEPYEISPMPGAWRPDPINPNQQPLGEEWYRVKPFVMNSATQFRCPPPPAMDSAEYAAAYNEVIALGGDGVTTPTIRTEEQSLIGIYWAYDGTPSLCAPPRLYNQIATLVAQQEGSSGAEIARLLALVNVGMADSGIACWESKFHYNFWRPVTGIREADPGTGPTGLGDGNPDTLCNEQFVPLCAPATNLIGPNFTPPFPAYPSGHATFGGALFEVLRQFYGRDDIAFTFVSDELNGETLDNEGNVRPLFPRSFTSFSQAEEENGQSRIYLGIHWAFDKTEGIVMGNKVADHIIKSAFTKRK
ncbi:MAG: phosphatase PAP2 family protein [Planctomycetia bacterium]|nr:MAG: phosphatase PAP2 family protein [Planctomycetia bacterium]